VTRCRGARTSQCVSTSTDGVFAIRQPGSATRRSSAPRSARRSARERRTRTRGRGGLTPVTAVRAASCVDGHDGRRIGVAQRRRSRRTSPPEDSPRRAPGTRDRSPRRPTPRRRCGGAARGRTLWPRRSSCASSSWLRSAGDGSGRRSRFAALARRRQRRPNDAGADTVVSETNLGMPAHAHATSTLTSSSTMSLPSVGRRRRGQRDFFIRHEASARKRAENVLHASA
jgi:hypothetical protein